MRVRTLIVDDEPVARRLLSSMVAGIEWMELIGTADRGSVAARIIEEQEPDLVFLDIRLPDVSGVELAEGARPRLQVIFTTAHDEYAIRALQLGAVDYLVKPFGRNRFLEAAARVRDRLTQTASHARVDIRERPDHAGGIRRVYVRDRGMVVPVLLEHVERVEAQGDYCLLCTASRNFLALIAISELERLLDPDRFVRVHRSHIVNLDCVAAFRPYDARRFVVVMKSGFELTASGTGTKALRALIV